jgi:hypothetical protein
MYANKTVIIKKTDFSRISLSILDLERDIYSLLTVILKTSSSTCCYYFSKISSAFDYYTV